MGQKLNIADGRDWDPGVNATPYFLSMALGAVHESSYGRVRGLEGSQDLAKMLSTAAKSNKR